METLPAKQKQSFLHTPRYVVEQSMKLPKLGEMSLEDKKSGLLHAVITGYAKMGHIGDHSVTQAAIVNDIISNPMLNKLSLLDIETAITRGVRCRYGDDFVMLNVKVVNVFINGWLGERCMVVDELEAEKRPKLQEENKVPIEIKQKECYTNLIAFLDEHKQVPKAWPFAPAFIHMESHGVIKLSNQEKEVLKTKVIAELEYMATRTGGDMVKSREIIANSKDLEHVKHECRRRAVIEWAELYLKTLTL